MLKFEIGGLDGQDMLKTCEDFTWDRNAKDHTPIMLTKEGCTEKPSLRTSLHKLQGVGNHVFHQQPGPTPKRVPLDPS